MDAIQHMGSFTYYVISRGGRGFQMLTVDYGGGGGGGKKCQKIDYVICERPHIGKAAVNSLVKQTRSLYRSPRLFQVV